MVRLGIDASQRVPSCAVSTDSGIAAVMTMEKPIENFTTLIQRTLDKAQIRLDALEEIVVCVGPGSQMGVRTTVVTGNALALALHVPVTGVLSTDALAAVSPVRGVQIVAVSAGRRWHTGKYDGDGETLRRLGALEVSDELPAETCPVLRSDVHYESGGRLCAEGLLLVAAQHRQLVTQSMLHEAAPYEPGNANG